MKSENFYKWLKNISYYISFEARRHKRKSISIIAEMLTLYLVRGIGPYYYIQAGMADKKIFKDQKSKHLNNKSYHKALNILNPKPYRKMTQHKVDEKALLTLSNIPTAKFIGFYHPEGGFDSYGKPLTKTSELAMLLTSYQGKRVCVKLPEGSGGKGFFAGKVLENIADNADIVIEALSGQSTKKLDQLINDYAELIKSEGLLFESYIEQCPEYAKFNTSSVNTVRTWVLQTEQGISVIGAYFRIGREGSLTDNGDGGGIMCPIDLDTGSLRKGLLTSTPLRDELTHHSDNNIQFEGTILSNWHDIISCSCETLRKLPYTRFAGLDVCMTPSGPAIIEVNVQPDKDGAAYAQIPSYLLAKAAAEFVASTTGK